MGRGRRLRRAADNPLPNDPAMQEDVDAQRAQLAEQQQIAAGRYDVDRQGQAQALAGLQGLANGTGPSLAQTQLQNQSDRNLAAQMAAMQSSRGGNLNATQMQAATAGMAQQQATNQAMAELRAQEQINAINASGQLATTMAGMSSDRQMGMMGMGQDALMQQYQVGAQRDIAQAQLRQQRLEQRNESRRKWADFGVGALGKVTEAAGNAMALSDVRVKVDVQDKPNIAKALASLFEGGDEPQKEDEGYGGGLGVLSGVFGKAQRKAIAKELANLKPYSYKYDKKARALGMPGGSIVGILAQDMEKAGPHSKSAVYDHPAGPKALHPAKAIGLALAACADQEHRLAKLEGKG